MNINEELAPLPRWQPIGRRPTSESVLAFLRALAQYMLNITTKENTDGMGLAGCVMEDAKYQAKSANHAALSIKWNYAKGYVDISMPEYVKNMLHKFQHPAPAKPQHAPHRWTAPIFGQSLQLTPPVDETANLDEKGKNRVQQVVGSTLFYGRAVDATILPAISTLSTNQTSPTERTNDDIKQLLDYLATHPDAVIRYYASDMILYVHSDASYLSEPKARSQLGGHFYLSARQQDPFKTPNPTDPIPPNNGAIKNNSTIMKCVLASAAEAEYGAVFFNMGDAVPIRKTLEEMGHPQPPTHIITDNSTAVGLANKTVKQRRSKAVDMRFYWVQDRVLQKQFLVYWRKGADNLADYMTKHFPARYHIVQRPNYLNVEDE